MRYLYYTLDDNVIFFRYSDVEYNKNIDINSSNPDRYFILCIIPGDVFMMNVTLIFKFDILKVLL